MRSPNQLSILTCVLVTVAAQGIETRPAGFEISGHVFVDRNANGTREAGEPGVAGVAVSDQIQVATTSADGSFRFQSGGETGLVYVSVPDGYELTGRWWQRAGPAAGPMTFGLREAPLEASFAFVHASDTHVSEASLPRMDRLRAVVGSTKPSLVLITGDLVRDALRVGEAEARGYYELFVKAAGALPAPVRTVPGNHEIFGIERDKSGVSADHPLYARGMYRHYLGPDYYSFNYGGVHFVGLNTIDHDDQWYYGHVDEAQLAWLARDLATVPATTPVVTFNHIPFFSTGEVLRGYTDAPPAPSLITVGGRTQFRHTVSNALAVLRLFEGRAYPLALGGHLHMRETIEYAALGWTTRFQQTAAVVGPNQAEPLKMQSGVTLYRVEHGRIDSGTFLPLDDPAIK
jgi:hypothetical protein